MNFPSPEFDNAVADMCHGLISDEDFSRLTHLLEENAKARDEYLWRLEVHGFLGSSAESLGSEKQHIDRAKLSLHTTLETPEAPEAPETSEAPEAALTYKPSKGRHRQRRRPRRVLGSFFTSIAAAAAIILCTAGLLIWSQQQQNAPSSTQIVQVPIAPIKSIAKISALTDVTWTQAEAKLNLDTSIIPNQHIELLSGSAEITFNNGAVVTLNGPAVFKPLSETAAFLTMGQVEAIAETPSSKGFTIETPVSRFVDVGTRFRVNTKPDGLSHLNVIEGEVDAYLKKTSNPIRLKTKQSLSIEPGNSRIFTRMEAGEDTSEYRFPTIQPPSPNDYADLLQGNARVVVLRHKLQPNSHPEGVNALIDGSGATDKKEDKSVFFFISPGGDLLMDLGSVVPIKKINCYMWHKISNRFRHRFVLYGYKGEDSGKPVDKALENSWRQYVKNPDAPLEAIGFERIARVYSDEYYPKDPVRRYRDYPRQQACSITAVDGPIGEYRYLVWRVEGRSSYREFDIYIEE